MVLVLKSFNSIFIMEDPIISSVISMNSNTENNSVANYYCNDCNENFISESDLIEHECQSAEVIPEQDQDLFLCAICEVRFNDNDSFRAHVESHSENPYACKDCGRTFRRLKFYQQHMDVHERRGSQINFTCNVCNKIFMYKSYLESHLKSHSKERPFKCGACCKSYRTSTDLKRHKTHKCKVILSKEYNKKLCTTSCASEKHNLTYDCGVCKEAFPSDNDLKQHLTRHKRDGQNVCLICEIKFPSEQTLIEHCLNYSCPDSLSCESYNMILNSSVELREHNKKEHIRNINEEKNMKSFNCNCGLSFECSLCSEIFDCKERYLNHCKLHDQKELIKCNACNENFSDLDIYSGHICLGKFTTNRSNVDKNIQKSISNQQNLCSDSSNGFMLLGNGIFQDKSSHDSSGKANELTMKNNYNCSKCKKYFNSESNLIQHTCPFANKALVIPSYQNSFTSKVFSANVELNKNDKLSCNICYKNFANRLSFKQHMLQHSNSQKSFFKSRFFKCRIE